MPKIERIDIVVTDMPTRLQRRMAFGGWDTGEPGALLGKPVLVKVTAEGVVGYAQIRPNSPNHFQSETIHSVVGAIENIYGPAMIGRSIFDVSAMFGTFDTMLAGNSTARSVLDVALHDAMGKALNVPVYALLGGLCQDVIPLEWSVSLAPSREQIVAEAVRAVEEFNVPVICLKAGGPEGWREDVDNFEAVRLAVGDSVQIGVDPNTGWSLFEARQAIRALRQFDLAYVEQPLHRDDHRGMAALRSSMEGIPLLADEGVFTLFDAMRLAELRAVDAFCLKLFKTGGLSGARKIIAVAEAADIRINIGGLAAFSQLEAAGSAHLYASLPRRRTLPAAEFIFGLGVLGPDPIVPETEFVVEHGSVRVPTGPGLGLIVDEAAVTRHALMTATVT